MLYSFLLGDSPVFEFYMPTFWNTPFHLQVAYSAYGDGTECSEMSAYKIQTPGNHPKEKTTTLQGYLKLFVHDDSTVNFHILNMGITYVTGGKQKPFYTYVILFCKMTGHKWGTVNVLTAASY
jgi:hypothetical protein